MSEKLVSISMGWIPSLIMGGLFVQPGFRGLKACACLKGRWEGKKNWEGGGSSHWFLLSEMETFPKGFSPFLEQILSWIKLLLLSLISMELQPNLYQLKIFAFVFKGFSLSRIIGLDGTARGHLVQPLALRQDKLYLTIPDSCLSNLFSSDRDDSLFHCLNALMFTFKGEQQCFN